MPTELTAREALDLREAIASVSIPASLQEVMASAPAEVRERVSRLLQESTNDRPNAGLVPLYVIRPGVGRGKGKHLYEADMLAKNAHVFKGWRNYVDHLSEAARKALGGLPRSIRDLGGRIVESWWDESVPADPQKGFGQGAVVGLSRPVPYVAELIEHDPDLIEASIAARATAVSPRRVGGEQVWVVEGIEPTGSVDWVTEAGAGGKVVSLIEAHYNDGGEDMAILESLTNEDLLEHIQQERPELLEAFTKFTKKKKADTDEPGDAAEDAADGGADELEEEIAALVKKGMNRKMAEKAAKRKLAQEGRKNEEEEDDEVPLTIDALREALSTDEGAAFVDELLEERVEKRLDEVLPERIEEALSEERELLMIEARADSERQIQIRDMRDEAARMVDASRLPDAFKAEVKTKFSITESGPTPALDILDELDGEGKIVKTAEEQLAEAVTAEVKRQGELLASINPTRVHAPAAAAAKDGDEKEVEEGAATTTGSRLTDAILMEAGVVSEDNLDKVYG